MIRATYVLRIAVGSPKNMRKMRQHKIGPLVSRVHMSTMNSGAVCRCRSHRLCYASKGQGLRWHSEMPTYCSCYPAQEVMDIDTSNSQVAQMVTSLLSLHDDKT